MGIDNPRRQWSPPAPILQHHREAASAWLRDHAGHIATVSPAGLDRWLKTLGAMVAGSTPAAEAALKVAAYASILDDKPAYWFTKATLKAAAERFTWFPSVAEIVALLDAETADKAQQIRAARQTVNGENAPRPRFTPEPRAVRLQAVIDSVTRHFGADDPRVAKARAELEAEAAKAGAVVQAAA